MPLDPEEQLHLDAAEGFIHLGMYLDADAALDDIDPFSRHLPEVLAVRVKIYRALEKWELMQVVARKLTEYDPDDVQWWLSWADATMKAESVEAARLILVTALDVLDHAGLHYDLARYECLLGNIEGATSCLKRCFDLAPGWRLRALEDPDLEPLWQSL
jgi:tetratricopeptide (TPR) repeat protein